MRIGVLGGTFNPPHIGHTHAASAARDALGLDLVLLIPANLPPHKTIPEGSASTAQRLEMTRLAAQSIGAQVCTVELDRGGKSYTADTLELLQGMYPGAEIWLIIGTDMFLTIHQWYEPERIFAAARLAVVAREADTQEEICAHKKWLAENYGARADVINTDAVEISSTELRDGEVPAQEFLSPEVLEYIRENRLYERREV